MDCDAEEKAPVSFLDALQDKYSDEDYRALFAGLICQEREREKKKDEEKQASRSPEKRRNFAYPPCVVLQNFQINRVGATGQILDWCLHLREIDLSFNQLNKWNEILALIQSIPSLEALNLSFNPLKDIRPEDVLNSPVVHACVDPSQSDNCLSSPSSVSGSQIKRLVLNGTHIDLQVVFLLLRLLKGVEELHLSLNGYSQFPREASENDPPSNVRELHVDSNQMESWHELTAIGRAFPALEILYASQNPLHRLHEVDDEALRRSFPLLKKLHVNETELHEWTALDKLNHLALLKDLRLLGTGLWREHEEFSNKARPKTPPSSPTKGYSSTSNFSESLSARQHVIARLPFVSLVNGTPVDPIERLDAERAFVRHFSQPHHHPPPKRYAELQLKHGPLKPLVEVHLGAPEMVDVAVTYGTTHRKPYRVSVKQTVGDMKKQLGRDIGMSPSKMRLFYVDSEVARMAGPEPDEMKYPGRMVYSYKVADGDEFIVEPK